MSATKKLKMAALAAATALGVAMAAPVQAAAVVNAALQPGENTFQDFDAERILRGDTVVTSGNFQVGDIIQTALFFDTVNGSQIPFIGPQFNAPYQLTAYAELRIAAITDAAGNPCASGFCLLTFAPSGNLGANVFAEIYENTGGFGTAANMNSMTPEQTIAAIRAQTLILEIGLEQAADFWQAGSLLDIGAAAALAPGAPQVAQGTFGLSVLNNPGSLPIADLGILSPVSGVNHDIVGNASAYQRETGVNPGWLVSSNLSATFNVVPAPGSIALLGLGLVAIGLVRGKSRA